MTGVLFRRAALHEALTIVAHVPPWRRDIQTPGMVRIVAKGGVAEVIAVDMGQQLTARLLCDGPDAELLAPMGPLSGLVGKAASDTVELAALDGVVRFSSGRTVSKLPSLGPAALPRRLGVGGHGYAMDAPSLRAGLVAALPATVEDHMRPALCAVYMHGVDGRLIFEAQDGNRFHTLSQPSDGAKVSAIIPRTAARTIVALLSEEEGTAVVSIDHRALLVECGDFTYQTTVAIDSYPTGKPAKLDAAAGEIRAIASELLDDLDCVCVVADARLRDFTLDLGPRIVASAFSVAHCTARGAIDVRDTYDGEPMTIGFQLPLVRDALTLFGDDEIIWRVGRAMESTFITSAARPGVEAVVAPVRPAADPERLAA